MLKRWKLKSNLGLLCGILYGWSIGLILSASVGHD